MSKKDRPRTVRREAEREQRKLVRERQRLAGLVPGGAPDRPIVVTTSSVIDGRARSTPCPLCAGALQLDEQTAETRFDRSLRACHMTCARCGVKRVLWFEIRAPLPS